MENRRWSFRLIVAGVWVLAALTWGSIAHHLLDLPDLGPAIAVVAVALVLALPVPSAARTRQPKVTAFVDEGQPSRP